ncbi:MAG: response regulator [Desulfobulbaceae bacterium]|nr:response regulator [Desulfobulbaceae bacterium]
MKKNNEHKNIDELLATRQVLVVEDDEGLNKLIQKTLRRAKFDCFGVLTGADAITSVKKNPNMVLIIDQQLPDMDGTDLVRNLINHANDIIFVAMTGHGDEKIAVEMMKLGAKDYLIKGYDLTDILPMVLKRVFSEIKTKKKLARAEDELKKLGAAVQQSPVSIIITDLEGCIEYVNPKFCNLTGYSKQEVIGKNPNLLQSDTTSPELYNNLWKTLLSGKEWRGEFQNKKKNGELYWEDALIFPIFNGDGAITHFLAVKEDITDRKQFEKHLLQTQKLEAIGTLAGGIAHDFNNILGAILGYTELAKEDSQPGSTIEKNLEKVLESGNRAKNLVTQILAFSRHDDIDFQYIQPVTIVKEAINMLRPSLPTTIEIIEDIDSATGHIFANPSQLSQIVMNLCTNAFHAMEETGGRLDISLKEIDRCRQDNTTEPHIDTGTFVQLSVRDSGTGMTQEVKDKIFDPYFTTKGIGKGTGMGLSIVHGIIKSYGGFITLSSEPGKGTAFHIFIPVIGDEILHNKDTVEPIPIGNENILFIDDEEILAEMGKDMLERLGYHVTVRKGSLEALETFQNQPDQFDVIITDQTMPGMTGVDLARRMLQIRPDIPVILCTGYSSVISEDKAKSMGIKEFALKPFGKNDIAQLIRKVLDEKS